jgi:hypothetical protein
LDEVVAAEEEAHDGRNTFLTAVNQPPPPPPAACFFPMPARAMGDDGPAAGDELLKSANLEAGRSGERKEGRRRQ